MPLANNFLRMHAQRYRKELVGFDETVRDRLMQRLDRKIGTRRQHAAVEIAVLRHDKGMITGHARIGNHQIFVNLASD